MTPSHMASAAYATARAPALAPCRHRSRSQQSRAR